MGARSRAAAGAVAIFSIAGGPGTATPADEAASPAGRQRCGDARRGLAFYVDATNRWRDRLGLAGLGPRHRPASCHAIRVRAEAWRDRSAEHRRAYDRWFMRTLAKWACIHRHEGPWDDPGAPYYGGLQMDLAFQRAHGWDFLERWGTADHWPIWAQLVTAERAYRTRGFAPWPTRRYC